MLKLKTDSSLLTCEHSESQQKKKNKFFLRVVWKSIHSQNKDKTKNNREEHFFLFKKHFFFPTSVPLSIPSCCSCSGLLFIFFSSSHYFRFLYIYILFCDLGCLRLLWYDPCRRCFFFFLSTLFCSFCEKVSLLLLSHFLWTAPKEWTAKKQKKN